MTITPGRTRTCDRGIGNQLAGYVTAGESSTYESTLPAPTSRTSSSDENLSVDDLDLQRVIARWPELPVAIRAGILAMVAAS
jgi:hypothetical protein